MTMTTELPIKGPEIAGKQRMKKKDRPVWDWSGRPVRPRSAETAKAVALIFQVPHYRILQAIAVLKGDAVAAYPNCPVNWTLEPQSLPREYQHRETIAALRKLADHAELNTDQR